MLLLRLEMLLLLRQLLRAEGDLRVVFGEYAHDPGGHFVVDDSFVVLADDVDTKFLGGLSNREREGGQARTTISSDLRSYGSDSMPSPDSRSPLINVPFELLTSRMYICAA